MKALAQQARACAHWTRITLSVWRAHWRYCRHVSRLRRKFGKEKIRVAFLVSELAKWKAQTLYDQMEKGNFYVPMVVVHPPKHGRSVTVQEEAAARETCAYFERRGMNCLIAYDFSKHKMLDLMAFAPDVVFYQQPWSIDAIHLPQFVSAYALLCYIPYYVPTFDTEFRLDCRLDFHRMLFRYFTLNEELAIAYGKGWSKFRYAGRFQGAGQPFLDYYEESKLKIDGDGMIIYAPHWTFTHPGNPVAFTVSTFLQTGKPILEYAKRHPEQKWLFKPHPMLGGRLVSSGAWTQKEVDDYYREWESIGQSCYTSDYLPLFSRSSVLVTDCDGFLMEYPPTGHPLIRLIPDNCDVAATGAKAELFDSFYKVHNLEEMYETFKLVIEKGADPKRDERVSACKKLQLVGNNAAANIVRRLDEIFVRRQEGGMLE